MEDSAASLLLRQAKAISTTGGDNIIAVNAGLVNQSYKILILKQEETRKKSSSRASPEEKQYK
jgi:hypothetical protein|nr:MAG TPA: hypothetical protein [Caudoviricetes sp.]